MTNQESRELQVQMGDCMCGLAYYAASRGVKFAGGSENDWEHPISHLALNLINHYDLNHKRQKFTSEWEIAYADLTAHIAATPDFPPPLSHMGDNAMRGLHRYLMDIKEPGENIELYDTGRMAMAWQMINIAPSRMDSAYAELLAEVSERQLDAMYPNTSFLISHVTLTADACAPVEFYASGIVRDIDDIQYDEAYEQYVLDCESAEEIRVESAAYLLGHRGESEDADEKVLAILSECGDSLLQRDFVTPLEDNDFVILPERDEEELTDDMNPENDPDLSLV